MRDLWTANRELEDRVCAAHGRTQAIAGGTSPWRRKQRNASLPSSVTNSTTPLHAVLGILELTDPSVPRRGQPQQPRSRSHPLRSWPNFCIVSVELAGAEGAQLRRRSWSNVQSTGSTRRSTTGRSELRLMGNSSCQPPRGLLTPRLTIRLRLRRRPGCSDVERHHPCRPRGDQHLAGCRRRPLHPHTVNDAGPDDPRIRLQRRSNCS